MGKYGTNTGSVIPGYKYVAGLTQQDLEEWGVKPNKAGIRYKPPYTSGFYVRSKIPGLSVTGGSVDDCRRFYNWIDEIYDYGDIKYRTYDVQYVYDINNIVQYAFLSIAHHFIVDGKKVTTIQLTAKRVPDAGLAYFDPNAELCNLNACNYKPSEAVGRILQPSDGETELPRFMLGVLDEHTNNLKSKYPECILMATPDVADAAYGGYCPVLSLKPDYSKVLVRYYSGGTYGGFGPRKITIVAASGLDTGRAGEPDKNCVGIGWSICRSSDTFDRDVGLDMALRRALDSITKPSIDGIALETPHRKTHYPYYLGPHIYDMRCRAAAYFKGQNIISPYKEVKVRVSKYRYDFPACSEGQSLKLAVDHITPSKRRYLSSGNEFRILLGEYDITASGDDRFKVYKDKHMTLFKRYVFNLFDKIMKVYQHGPFVCVYLPPYLVPEGLSERAGWFNENRRLPPLYDSSPAIHDVLAATLNDTLCAILKRDGSVHVIPSFLAGTCKPILACDTRYIADGGKNDPCITIYGTGRKYTASAWDRSVGVKDSLAMKGRAYSGGAPEPPQVSYSATSHDGDTENGTVESVCSRCNASSAGSDHRHGRLVNVVWDAIDNELGGDGSTTSGLVDAVVSALYEAFDMGRVSAVASDTLGSCDAARA